MAYILQTLHRSREFFRTKIKVCRFYESNHQREQGARIASSPCFGGWKFRVLLPERSDRSPEVLCPKNDLHCTEEHFPIFHLDSKRASKEARKTMISALRAATWIDDNRRECWGCDLWAKSALGKCRVIILWFSTESKTTQIYRVDHFTRCILQTSQDKRLLFPQISHIERIGFPFRHSTEESVLQGNPNGGSLPKIAIGSGCRYTTTFQTTVSHNRMALRWWLFSGDCSAVIVQLTLIGATEK